MFVASNLILSNLNPATEAERMELLKKSPEAFTAIQKADLSVITGPYAALGVLVLAVLVVFALYKLPAGRNEVDHDIHFGRTMKRLFRNPRYIWGVVAQAFYVGAQIMVWTFIIQYAGA